MEDKQVDIQEDLGSVSESDFTFEFFITSTATPNYKYRVLFLHYDIPFYPVILYWMRRLEQNWALGKILNVIPKKTLKKNSGKSLVQKK